MQKSRPESETGPAYPIASVNNALLLLLLFREQPRVRLTDACKCLGVAHSTAHRLLAMLAHHGFVQQEPVTRAYIAGPALVEVGLAVVGSLNVWEQARPMMEELAVETGETVHLGVSRGPTSQASSASGCGSALTMRRHSAAMTVANSQKVAAIVRLCVCSPGGGGQNCRAVKRQSSTCRSSASSPTA